MTLTLHLHPLSSYCHKVLIALYETGTPFTAQTLNLGDAAERAAFRKISPFGKMPTLTDDAQGAVVNEASIIIEYLQQHYPGKTALIPTDPEAALAARKWDRIFDLYPHAALQKVVGDKLRAADKRDAQGVEEALATLRTSYDLAEEQLATMRFIAGNNFTMADCAAAPPLFYGQALAPFAQSHPRLASYFDALVARPSYARVLQEAKPFLQYFPFAAQLPEKFKP